VPARAGEGIGRGCLADQVADDFLEAAQHARLGLADRGLAHAQGRPHLGRGLILHRGPPEGLPGRLLEVSADQFQGAVVDVADLGGVGRIVGKAVGGEVLKQPVGVRTPLRRRLALAALVEIAQLVPGNGPQPAAERPRSRSPPAADGSSGRGRWNFSMPPATPRKTFWTTSSASAPVTCQEAHQ